MAQSPLPWIGRVVLIVLDGAGVGALPDAARYGDAGANTLGHVAAAAPLRLPNLQRLGLGNIVDMPGVPPARDAAGAFGKLAQRSAGKDSTVGHWELMGVVCPEPFPTYPEGFPAQIIGAFAERTGRGVIGNRPASGTQIIEELFDEHRRTGKWIVYTSADSVFQVAAHEDVIPSSELYEACRAAAELLFAGRAALRVIARPFTGERGALRRTGGRRDFNMPPPGATALDALAEGRLPVVTVGKIDDIFSGRGITRAERTGGNVATLARLEAELELRQDGLCFVNLVDFDMLWGHRNDAAGFARGLTEFDEALGRVLALLRERDILVITADHGCDPTMPGTDHTREYVPLIVWGPLVRAGMDLGVRASFADAGATVCEALGVPAPRAGMSAWREIAATHPTEVSRVESQRVDWFRRRSLVRGGPG